MTQADIQIVESQLRQHLHYGLSVRWRGGQAARRLGHLGKRPFLEAGVRFLRYPRRIHVGDDVVIKRGAELCACNDAASIRIGDRTTIGHYTFIYASAGIHIGADCLIAPFVYLVDSDHVIARGQRINTQGNVTAPIHIEDDVWLATRATILKGVTIGRGAVVAASAVVSSDVPPYAIVGGVPARVIGERR